MKNQKGITLVALIITIIVMVILTGVIIATSMADGGIIDRAQMAGSKQEYANAEERIKAQCEYITTGKNAGKVDLSATASNIRTAGIKEVKDMTSTENLLTVELIDGTKVEIQGVNGNTGIIGNIYGKDGEYMLLGNQKLTLIGSENGSGLMLVTDYKVIGIQEAFNMIPEGERNDYESLLAELEERHGKIEKVLVAKDFDTLQEIPVGCFISGDNELFTIDGEIYQAKEELDESLKKVIYKTSGQYEGYTNTSWSENDGETVSRTVVIDYKNQMINTCSMTSQGVGLGMFGNISVSENDETYTVKINGDDYTIKSSADDESGKEILKIADYSGKTYMCLENDNGNKKLFATEGLLNYMKNGEDVKILSFESGYDVRKIGLEVE